MTTKTPIALVTQPTATSYLGGYVRDWYNAHGYPVTEVNCRTALWPRLWPALLALHPNRKVWYRRRWEIGLYSPAAWDRHTRLNGRMIDKHAPGDAKILQVGKEYFPHPRYREKEYYIFINYNARLASLDGYTPWRPHPRHEQEFIEREGLLFRHASHVFTAGEYLRQDLIQHEGVDPGRVTTVGNGVHPYFLERPPQNFRDDFTGKLLFVGWDFGLKGGQYILEAMPEIRRQYPNVELHIVGPGEPQRLQYGALAEQPGVVWLGQERSRDRLIEHFRSADLFLMPSLRDSYGFVFLEAMSQGTPCLGADINGMPEIIADGKTGYVVPRKNAVAIADAICRYYSNPANKKAMAEATYQRLLEKFTWDVVMGKMNRLMGVRD